MGDLTFMDSNNRYIESRTLVDHTGTVLSDPTSKSMNVKYGDSGSLDAFGRLRVSNPYTLFDFKQIADNSNYQFFEKLTGAATSTYQYNRSSTFLATTATSGDRVIRQSARYFPYVPGKAHNIIMTGIFGTPTTNVNQYVGYGDDLNGIFFTYQGTQFGVMIRTATSGTPVDTFYPQSSWNIDAMDGSGSPTNPSGINLDNTKANIYKISFQ